MKEDKKYTVKKVEFKAIKDDWSWFEVLLYNEKDDKIPAYTFSPVMFNSIDNRINKSKTGRKEEEYTNPNGEIEVEISESDMNRSVTLSPE